MFFKYSLFELKVLLRNRKQWILGLFLILFFPVYFQFYIGIEPETFENQKTEERETQTLLLNGLPHDLRDTEEGQEIYDNHTSQLSAINWQLISIYENDEHYFVHFGRELNRLRLAMHDQGNPHVISRYVVPIEEIEKENEIYNYLAQNALALERNPYVAREFLVALAKIVSGLLLYTIVLLICSDMLLYENEHQTVMRSLPISFLTKVSSKVILHFLFIVSCLGIGTYLGYHRAFKLGGKGNFIYPILVYENNSFKAIPIKEYLLNVSVALLISICMIILIALLFNMLFKHVYITVLAGLGLFFLPDLLNFIGLKAKVFYPIKYIDIVAVLSGEMAERFGDASIEYSNVTSWMIGFTIVTGLLILVKNWLAYRESA